MTTPNGMQGDPGRAPQEPTMSAPGASVTDAPGQQNGSAHHQPAGDDEFASHAGHSGHGPMMIICCIPMLVIAGALFFTGAAAGSGAIVAALLCTAMMASMMFMPGMRGGHDRRE